MMLGYLLARQGVAVTVLEKHQDFFRDFRGDTVHPSTLELFHELGLLEDFLKLPHQKLRSLGGVFGDFHFQAISFGHVPTRCKFVALMPQWDFLNFLSSEARKFPNFDLRMGYEATGLLRDASRITGVEAQTPEGPVQIQADLVVGCDGRHSTVRRAAGLEVLETGVPIDVLWFRISRHADDPDDLFGIVNYGRALVLINRGGYFQAGLIIRKDSFPQIKECGLNAFRETLAKLAPYLRGRAGDVESWEQIKLLTVQINRLQTWYRSGLLCIGDAAHAMSPAGGVGINLAVQDAVATANLLAQPLRDRSLSVSQLGMVQQRREFPARVTQFLQLKAHQGLVRTFSNPGPIAAPRQLKIALGIPGLPQVLGRVVGIGIRPEHVGGAPKRSASAMALGVGAAALTVVGVFALFSFSRR